MTQASWAVRIGEKPIKKWPMDPDFLALLACPQCKGELTEVTEPEFGLVCPACRLRFPVKEQIPVLLLEEASPHF
ncbi:MAG: hypothetical protein A2527_08605 [Candidatus Lambdaproteobacteria bacterium RIFOXYD2_FULL_50_16]|uniref:Uncharacterized protein n=1 Tax=Candidatus Lambdaproteobacteria bacterium RIFOXYD2_FULL_50_16 TaxID=1817772 RepID=A0A1F6GAT6_9PROT|nr:MAG: hypothetical protein A2527_08605 [Candidatus Lambdaproteobacteria bacterium RIFOXYD2_FULL_50_16]